MAKILVTGAAGFIGYHVARTLLERGDEVVGLDNMNAYYDVGLKQARLDELTPFPGFTFARQDLADADALMALMRRERFARVVNLAAQPGVRYSLQNPAAYASSNITGFLNLLEGCRHTEVEHLVYASSSSVYGANTSMPYSIHDNVDHPISLYAASKKANELMAHSYSHLFRLPTTGLRFFTVYGPWGRPDMAVYSFTRSIVDGKPIDVYNNGNMRRDFTYVDDIVEGVVRVMDTVPEPNAAWDAAHPDPATSLAPYRLYNIGNNRPVPLLTMIETLGRELGLPVEMRMKPLQPGDVLETFADIDALQRAVGFAPSTPIDVGLARWVAWFRAYHGVPVPAAAAAPSGVTTLRENR